MQSHSTLLFHPNILDFYSLASYSEKKKKTKKTIIACKLFYETIFTFQLTRIYKWKKNTRDCLAEAEVVAVHISCVVSAVSLAYQKYGVGGSIFNLRPSFLSSSFHPHACCLMMAKWLQHLQDSPRNKECERQRAKGTNQPISLLNCFPGSFSWWLVLISKWPELGLFAIIVNYMLDM